MLSLRAAQRLSDGLSLLRPPIIIVTRSALIAPAHASLKSLASGSNWRPQTSRVACSKPHSHSHSHSHPHHSLHNPITSTMSSPNAAPPPAIASDTPRHLKNHTTTTPQPTHSTTVTIDEDGQEKTYTAITEGKATILFPESGEVFYNPIQNFNRDLSVLAVKCFGELWLKEKMERIERGAGGKAGKGTRGKKRKIGSAGEEERERKVGGTGEPMNVDEHLHGESRPGSTSSPSFRILDALSATGLRALRYAHEIPSATELTANDLSASAVESIHRNIKYNSPLNPSAAAKITPSMAGADAHMYLNPRKYHVIDLDPYGTAAPFIDAALQSIVVGGSGVAGGGGGLLCVTCTDAGVWASTGYSEKCYALYGGQPLKGDCSHEGGLRLIIYSIATTAAKYGLSIQPLLSLSIDFYARVFVRVTKSPAEVKHLASRSMIVYNCDNGCGAWKCVPLGRAQEIPDKRGQGTFWKYSQPQAPEDRGFCECCGFRMHVAGPMWGGELHDPAFLRELLGKTVQEADALVYTTLPRVRGMVATALNECTFAKMPIPVRVPAQPAGEAGTTAVVAAVEPTEPTTAVTAPIPPTIISLTHPPPPPPYPPLPTPYFFFLPTRLSKTVHSTSPPLSTLRGAILSLGYPVGRSHCRPNSIKTTAPYPVLWEIMRQWVSRYAPIKEANLASGGAGIRIIRGINPVQENPPGGAAAWAEMSQKVGKVAFDEELGRDEERERDKSRREVRYQQNPTANWGPMRAAKGKSGGKPFGGKPRRDEGDGGVVEEGEEGEEEVVVKEEDGERKGEGGGGKKVKLDPSISPTTTTILASTPAIPPPP